MTEFLEAQKSQQSRQQQITTTQSSTQKSNEIVTRVKPFLGRYAENVEISALDKNSEHGVSYDSGVALEEISKEQWISNCVIKHQHITPTLDTSKSDVISPSVPNSNLA